MTGDIGGKGSDTIYRANSDSGDIPSNGFELRFQTKQTTAPIYKKLTILILSIISH